MAQQIKVNDQVSVGPQPAADEIAQLSQDGFKAVVNFRTEGEEEQPLSPQAEAGKVESAGMEYVHIPVSPESMKPDVIDDFRERFEKLPKPVFAHCRSGKRAGAMVMMHLAVEQGISGDETLNKAEKMGFECDHPKLKEVVRSYVDSRVSAT